MAGNETVIAIDTVDDQGSTRFGDPSLTASITITASFRFTSAATIMGTLTNTIAEANTSA